MLRTSAEVSWQLREHVFTSRVPVVGGAIAAFRALWNSVSTSWSVRAIIEQQSAINRALAARLEAQEQREWARESRLEDQEKRGQDHDLWLVEQDHAQADLTRELAYVKLQLGRTNQLVEELQSRLARLDTSTT
jgi:hypothetical protein